MTGLLRYQDKDEYRVVVESYVEGYIESVYETMWEEIQEKKTKYIPTLGQICEWVYGEVYTDVKYDLVQAAKLRKDYEIHGVSEEDFPALALSGSIIDEALEPDIDYKEFVLAIRDYLLEGQFFFVDYHDIVRNMPICEVW